MSIGVFQFTRPRGARLVHRRRDLVRPACFNSRAHGGRDYRISRRSLDSTVSIHAPTGGATTRCCRSPKETGVSIHAPTGGATKDEILERYCRTFQFTRPRGARLAMHLTPDQMSAVSIHAPTGGATGHDEKTPELMEFQFTRPRGARPSRPRSRTSKRCFNSRAHGGRDPRPGGICPSPHVSIHAPTGGATVLGRARAEDAAVSIHAPTGGATQSVAQDAPRSGFNSRAHGGRDGGRDERDRLADVSIHAPTGGATRRSTRAVSGRGRFNSRAHGGRDKNVGQATTRSAVSIHAPTGGATQRSAGSHTPRRFNSRAHGGRDFRTADDSNVQISFNSRAHGGRDLLPLQHGGHYNRFNSRAHGGRDRPRDRRVVSRARFQFTRPRGARLNAAKFRLAVVVSIHAPTGGATCSPSPASRTRPRFNSRAHGGRDSRRHCSL